MKGLATRTIVLIVIGLIVLGVVISLLYIGLGPFREAVRFNSCKAMLAEWCTTQASTTNPDPPDYFTKKCSGNFGGRGEFCTSNCFPGGPQVRGIDCSDV